MKKIKALFSTLLIAVVLFSAGFTSVSAEEISGLTEKDETITPSYIPLSINLDPQNVTRSGVTSHTVRPRINWYDGISNSFSVSYTNAYGQKQLSQTFTSYSVQVSATTYRIASGETRFSGRHTASVSSNAGSTSMTGTITLNRR